MSELIWSDQYTAVVIDGKGEVWVHFCDSGPTFRKESMLPSNWDAIRAAYLNREAEIPAPEYGNDEPTDSYLTYEEAYAIIKLRLFDPDTQMWWYPSLGRDRTSPRARASETIILVTNFPTSSKMYQPVRWPIAAVHPHAKWIRDRVPAWLHVGIDRHLEEYLRAKQPD